MTNSYLPWITGAFGLLGALIGAGASVLTIYFQLKIQDRRALLRQATELAQSDYRYRVEHAPPGTPFPPIAVFIAYEVRLLKLMEKGRLTPAAFRRLSAEHDELQIQPSIWRQHARQQQGHDRIALARTIAARSEPRFIELESEPRRKARLSTRFMEIPRNEERAACPSPRRS